MKKAIRHLIPFIALIALFSSCNSIFFGEKIKGEGPVESEFRSIDDFNEIYVGGSFAVHLIAGKTGQITIKAQKNLLPHILAEVKNRRLKIGVAKGVSLTSDAGMTIDVPIGNLSKLTLGGSGKIYSEFQMIADELEVVLSGSGTIDLDLRANEIDCELNGSGNIQLTGKTDDLDIDLSGSGTVRASDLITDNVEAEINGSGNIHVIANEKIKGRISGSGTLYYSGNPNDKDFKSSGSGSFRAR